MTLPWRATRRADYLWGEAHTAVMEELHYMRIAPGMLALQIINLIMLVAWIVLLGAAVLELRRSQDISARDTLIWALVIALVPVIGPALFFMARGIRTRIMGSESK